MKHSDIFDNIVRDLDNASSVRFIIDDNEDKKEELIMHADKDSFKTMMSVLREVSKEMEKDNLDVLVEKRNEIIV